MYCMLVGREVIDSSTIVAIDRSGKSALRYPSSNPTQSNPIRPTIICDDGCQALHAQ